MTGMFSDDPFDDWDNDFDDDMGAPKEEPDCFSCDDSGCRACARHPEHCDCAVCFENAVDEYDIWDAPDREVPVFAGPYDDDFPF